LHKLIVIEMSQLNLAASGHALTNAQALALTQSS